jgi:hypothetical protein
MSIHGLCFDEAQSGRCGFECRAFKQGECEIYKEVVFNAPITFDDFQEASEYYNLEGTEMNRITDLIVSQVEKHAQVIRVLAEINKVPWDTLKVDEPVVVFYELDDFCNGTGARIAHFHSFNKTNELINAWQDGTTSITGKDFVAYKYALPQALHKELIKQK